MASEEVVFRVEDEGDGDQAIPRSTEEQLVDRLDDLAERIASANAERDAAEEHIQRVEQLNESLNSIGGDNRDAGERAADTMVDQLGIEASLVWGTVKRLYHETKAEVEEFIAKVQNIPSVQVGQVTRDIKKLEADLETERIAGPSIQKYMEASAEADKQQQQFQSYFEAGKSELLYFVEKLRGYWYEGYNAWFELFSKKFDDYMDDGKLNNSHATENKDRRPDAVLDFLKDLQPVQMERGKATATPGTGFNTNV
jgi:chromosome segregation ATPase